MKNSLSNTVYDGLSGAGIAAGLLFWLVVDAHGLPVAAAIIAAALLLGVAVFGIERSRKQTAILPTITVAAAIVVSLVALTAALSGDPLRALAYTIAGIVTGTATGVVGGRLGPRAYSLLLILALFAGVGVAIADAWSVVAFSLDHWLGVTLATGVILFALGTLAPSRAGLFARITGAAAILFAAGWFARVFWQIDQGSELEINRLLWIPTVVLGIVYLLMVDLVEKTLIDKLWITKRILPDFAMRQLNRMFPPHSPAEVAQLEATYRTIPAPRRAAWLRSTLNIKSAGIWLDILRMPGSTLGADVQDIILSSFEHAKHGSGEYRAIRHMLEDIALSNPPSNWETSFDALVDNATPGAIHVCQQRFAENNLAPLQRWAEQRKTLPVIELTRELGSVFSLDQIALLKTLLNAPQAALQQLAANLAAQSLDAAPDPEHHPLVEEIAGSHSITHPAPLIALATYQKSTAARLIRYTLGPNTLLTVLSWLDDGTSALQQAALEALGTSFEDGDAAWQDQIARAVMPVVLTPPPASGVMLRAHPDIAYAMSSRLLHPEDVPALVLWLEHDSADQQRLASAHIADGYATGQPEWTQPLVDELVGNQPETYLPVLSTYEPETVTAMIADSIGDSHLEPVLRWMNAPQASFRQTVSQAIAAIYAAGSDTLREAIESDLRAMYHTPPNITRKIVQKGLDLQAEWLYRFDLRPAVSTEEGFYLAELVSEPDDLITASHITNWFYHNGDEITCVVVSGHANHAICKEVSTKIYNSILDLQPESIDEVLVVTGAGLIKVDHDQRKPKPVTVHRRCTRRRTQKVVGPPLADLRQELTRLQADTGLVNTHDVKTIGHDDTVNQIRQQLQAGLQSGEPLVLAHADESFSQAVFLPFYALSDADLTPLTFEIPISALGAAYPDIVDAHQREMQDEMVADAKQRKETYVQWLAQDSSNLNQRLSELLKIIVPGISPGTEYILRDHITEALLKEETFQPPSLRDMGRFQQMLPGDAALMNILNLIRSTIFNQPVTITPVMMQKLQERKFPITGKRNYADAVVVPGEDDGQKANLLDLTLSILPDVLCSDLEWIEHMDELLRKFDDKNPDYAGQRLTQMSLSVLVDSFLRGWPSIFLSRERLRKQYDGWLANSREAVWRTIHAELQARAIQMSPLQADSVVFSVEAIRQGYLSITPYYLCTTRNLAMLVSPHVGIPYFIHNWQHRTQEITHPADCDQSNRERALAACENGETALLAGDTDTALAQFKLALSTHMTLAAERIFVRYWEQTTCSTLTKQQDLIDLVEAVREFLTDTDRAVPALTSFNERHPYFLPEPYMLLAYHEQTKNTALSRLQRNLRLLIEQDEKLVNDLIEDKVLIFDDERKDYILNHNKEEAKSFDHQKRLEALLAMPLQQRLDDLRARMVAQTGLPHYSTLYSETLDPRMAEAVSDDKLQAELADVRRGNTKNRLIKHDTIMAEVGNANNEIRALNKQIWEALRRASNPYLRQATSINRDYVDLVLAIQDHQQVFSDAYKHHAGPAGALTKAEAHYELVRAMNERIYWAKDDLLKQIDEVADSSKARMIIKRVGERLDEIRKKTALKPFETRQLQNLIEHLIEIEQVDRMTRNRVQRMVDDVRGHHMGEAYQLYMHAAQIPELTEIRQRATLLEQRLARYRRCMSRLKGVPQAPLENTLLNANFEVLAPEAGLPPNARVELDTAAHQISIVPPQGAPVPVLHYQQLSDAERDHLHALFARPDDEYVKLLRRSPLKPAYAMLLMPTATPPLLSHWRTVLDDLEPWLIRVMAYTGVGPEMINERDRDNALAAFDDKPVVTQVIADPHHSREKFLAGYEFSGERQEFQIVR